jgi:hypothetical protein
MAGTAEAFRTDLPKADVHYLDAGHFALERLTAKVIEGFQGGFVILEHRTQAGQQLLARFGHSDASRGPFDQANPELLLELA